LVVVNAGAPEHVEPPGPNRVKVMVPVGLRPPLTVAVSVTVPPTTTDGEASVAIVGVPGLKITKASPLVIALPSIVPLTSAVPDVVELVNVAVYVPSPTSVTPVSEPAVELSRTVSPPEVSSFPFASSACTVIVEVDDPSAAIEPGEAEIVDVAPDAAPGAKVTSASPLVIGLPSIVPLTSAVPDVVELVNVAVYVPSPISVTPVSEPAVELKRTVSPPEVSSFPFVSSACTVTVEVDDPSAVIETGDAEIVDVAPDAAPGAKVTNASPLAIAWPSIVPLTSAVPDVVELVSVAVYVPSPISVTPVSAPAVELSVTVSPPELSSFPFASSACTVIVEVDDPSAVIEPGEAEIVDVAADAAPGAKVTNASPLVIALPSIVPLTSAVPDVVELVSVAV
jgi:hypothetical protein